MVTFLLGVWIGGMIMVASALVQQRFHGTTRFELTDALAVPLWPLAVLFGICDIALETFRR